MLKRNFFVATLVIFLYRSIGIFNKLHFLKGFKCYLRIMGLPKAVHITPTEKCLIGAALQSENISMDVKGTVQRDGSGRN
jgi:hypothetical protein